jgi:hypothetical protein
MADLIDIVRQQKNQGKSLIEIQKWLRDNGYSVPYAEVKITYQKVLKE